MTGFFPEGYATRDLLMEELQAKVQADGLLSLDQAEAIVFSMKDKSADFRRATFNRLRMLEHNAKPGNWAWKRLENDFGYSLDYTEADHGNQVDAFAY